MQLAKVLWPRKCFILILALVLLSSFGCQTTSHRARQYSQAFNQLTPKEQQQLENGEIKLGDTREMVYIAMGAPSEANPIVGPNDIVIGEAWIFVGSPAGKQSTIEDTALYRFNTPNEFTFSNPLSSSKTNRIRIIFADSRVTHIEIYRDDESPHFNHKFPVILLPQNPQQPAPSGHDQID